MVTQLLSQARSDQSLVIAKQPLDLVAMARDAVFDLLPLARSSGVDLGFEGEGRVTVHADAVLLREAIVNLVHNAIVYTAAAGPAGVVTVHVQDDAEGPRLEVCDNGPGIPADERDRVLERFYRRPGAAGTGSGLGLSIVKDLCCRHGIELELLDGAEGRGLRAVMRWSTRR
jgi:two-component system sensor histidine kinase TctE